MGEQGEKMSGAGALKNRGKSNKRQLKNDYRRKKHDRQTAVAKWRKKKQAFSEKKPALK